MNDECKEMAKLPIIKRKPSYIISHVGTNDASKHIKGNTSKILWLCGGGWDTFVKNNQ